jgi:hypothetical protein
MMEIIIFRRLWNFRSKKETEFGLVVKFFVRKESVCGIRFNDFDSLAENPGKEICYVGGDDTSRPCCVWCMGRWNCGEIFGEDFPPYRLFEMSC